jgi:EmrB/QacA subfamily drug resistance transporter
MTPQSLTPETLVNKRVPPHVVSWVRSRSELLRDLVTDPTDGDSERGAATALQGGLVWMATSTTGRVAEMRVLLVASFGAFLAFLDATIVNVAFPSIRESFPGTSIGELSWVLNAYNIVFAAFLIVCGRLADLLGRRRTFVTGVVLFTLASALCGAAPSVDLLVAARVAQAFGAALLVPASLAVIVEAFPDDKRAHAIGLWGATAAVAAGLGPPIGGALVEAGGWRWAFFVNLPFGVAAVLAARGQLVESRAPGRRTMPDLTGAALLAGSLALLNLGIVKGNDWGWSSAAVVVSVGSALVLGLLFVASSRRHRSPLLDPTLLRIRSFAVANIATVVAGLGFYAYLLTNILWLQYVWGYSVLRAGLALVPGAVVAAVIAAVLGPLAERRGYRYVVVPGALVWAGAYAWYHQRVGLAPDFLGEWLPGQILSGIGVGATLPVLGSAALAAVPGGRYATASAVVSSARQLGGVLGIAVLVVIIGTPTAATAVDAFRDGWLLSIGAFLLVAVLALPIGRLARTADEDAVDDRDRPVVHLPEQRADPDSERRTGTSHGTLSDVPLFAGLAAPALNRLAAAARMVHLPAGDWLMHEGDPPGSVYVVRSGRLEVLIAGSVVRVLGPGAVIGELALLTGEARSAAVRGRRDSTLLEVTREDFTALIETDPAATRVVVTQLAERLRDPRPVTERPAQPSVVAVVGLHAGDEAALIGHGLLAGLARHLRVAAPGRVEPEQLERAERDNDRVLLVAPGDEPEWRDFCLRQADHVVLVASSTTPVTGTTGRVDLPQQPDLVLVGARPSPAGLADWAAANNAWQVTVVDSDPALALRPLAERIAGRSLGLVLAGGGARAFAHIGVLRELEESGLHVDRVAGCSIGAIIAGGYATGLDGAALEARCYEEFVRRRPFSDYTLPRHSLARGHRARAGLVRAFGAETLIEGLPRQFHTVSTDLVARTRQVHRRGNLVDAVAASARLPVLFPPIPDGQRLLVDGGILDNLPVDLLTERDEGPVVAVNIAMGGSGRPPGATATAQRPARVPALGETLLRTMMIGSGGAVAAARQRGAVVVTPAPMGVGLLEFHQLDRMVAAGRLAARELLDQLDRTGLAGWPRRATAPAVGATELRLPISRQPAAPTR